MVTKSTVHVFTQDPTTFALKCSACGMGLSSPIHVRRAPDADRTEVRGVAKPEKAG